jgi:hypothetical protein
VARHAPLAAARAARLGAHREAAEQLQLALRYHEEPGLRPGDVAQHEGGQAPGVAPQQGRVPPVLALAAIPPEDVRTEPQAPTPR